MGGAGASAALKTKIKKSQKYAAIAASFEA